MVDSADLIAGIVKGSPRHRAGTRPIHSYGIGVTGRYRPTDVAGRFTTARPLVDPGTAVTVRFSNSSGNEGSPDCDPDVRGMAVRFHGDDGEPVFDLVSTTLPVFFVRDVESFRRFTTAAAPPDPPPSRPWWADLVDTLYLRQPPTRPNPSAAGLFAFSQAHPEACPALVANGSEPTPESYAARSYHPVHAFRLTAADGTSRFVRFHWEPVAGVRISTTTAEQYLMADLRDRVQAGEVQFVLRAQIAELGDDTADLTRPWPQTRRRIVLGHLSVDAVIDDPDVTEDLAFDPSRLPPGVDCDPDDEIFAVRGEVYRASARARRRERALRP